MALELYLYGEKRDGSSIFEPVERVVGASDFDYEDEAIRCADERAKTFCHASFRIIRHVAEQQPVAEAQAQQMALELAQAVGI